MSTETTKWWILPLVAVMAFCGMLSSTIAAYYQLDIVKSGAGKGTVRSQVSGIFSNTSSASTFASYSSGSVVNLTASPAVGSYFKNWSSATSACNGQTSSQSLACGVAMDAAKTVTADFTTTPPLVFSWTASFGGNDFDWDNSVARQRSDGSYLVVGMLLGDIGLFVVDANGALINGSEHVWDVSGGWDTVRDLQLTADGGALLLGSGNRVVKLNADLSVAWSKNYTVGSSQLNSILQTQDGGYVAAGLTGTTDGALVLKLDAVGTVIWQKTYGNASNDTASSIRQTTDGGYIVGGTSTGPFGWVFKLDAAGTIQWQYSYGSSNGIISSVSQTSDGGFVAAGSLSNGATFDDGWVLRLDAGGSVIWQTAFGSGDADSINSVEQTIDGGFIAAGKYRGIGGRDAAWLVKLDTVGARQWDNVYDGGTNDFLSSVEQTADGGYIVAGATMSFGTGGDIWLMKLTENGTVASCPGSVVATSGAVFSNPVSTRIATAFFAVDLTPSEMPETPTLTAATISKNATACANPVIAVTPASPVDFGSVAFGSNASTLFTITNSGNVPLGVTGISISSGGSDFSVSTTGGTCTSLSPTIPAGSDCTVSVKLASASIGTRTGILTVTSLDPVNPTVNIALTGSAAPAHTCSWASSANGNWNVPGNWINCGGGVPGATDNAVVNVAGTYTVTVDANATVNSLTVGNADGTQTLSIPNTKALTLNNNSSFTAGGFLNILSGGTLTILKTLGLAGNSIAGTISGGTITGTGITTSNGTLNNVTIGSSMTQTGGQTYIAGNLTLADGVNLSLNSSYFRFTTAASTIGLTGGATSATITLNGTPFAANNGNNSGVVTISSGITIQGYGSITQDYTPGGWISNGTIHGNTSGQILSLGSTTFTNNGTIKTTLGTLNITPTSLVLNNGTQLQIAGGSMSINPANAWSNNGAMSVTAGTLNLGGSFTLTSLGSYSRSGGIVNISASGNLNLAGGTFDTSSTGLLGTGGLGTLFGTISGGTITGSALTSSNGTLNNVTIGSSMTKSGQTYIIGNLTLADGVNFSLDNSYFRFQSATATIGLTGGATSATITMNGTLLATNNGNNSGVVTIVTGVTIQGYGSITQDYTNGGWINNGTITGNVASQTLSLGSTTFTNDGTIRSTLGTLSISPTSLVLNAGTQLQVAGGTMNITPANAWSNNGAMSVTAGILNLGSSFTLTSLGSYTRSGGTVNITGTLNLAGGTFDTGSTGLLGTGGLGTLSGTLSGGTITGTAINTSNGTLNNVTIGSSMNQTGGQTYIIGNLTLADSVNLSLNNNYFRFSSVASTIALSGGATSAVITLNNTLFTANFGNNSGVVTIDPGVVIQGYGSINQDYANGGWINNGTIIGNVASQTLNLGSTTFTNNGTIRTNAGGLSFLPTTLVLNAGTQLQVAGGSMNISPTNAWSNSGAMNVSAGLLNLGSSFTLPGLGTFSRNGGTVNITGTLNLSGTFDTSSSGQLGTGGLGNLSGTISGGTITGTALNAIGGTLNNVTIGSSMTRAGGQTYIVGNLTLADGVNLTLDNNYFRFSGATPVIGLASGATSASITLNGTLFAANFGNNSGVVTIGPGVTVQGYGNMTQDYANGGWINSGTIRAASGTLSLSSSTFTQSGTLDVASGASFSRTAGFTSTNAISGSGTVTVGTGAAKLVNQGAITAAGAGTTGTLTTSGDLQLDAGTSVNIDIGGTGAGQFDKIAVTGAAQITGNFNVNLVNTYTPGYLPNVGDSFTIMTCGSGCNSGSFSIPATFSPGPGRKWSLTYNPTSIVLTTTAGVAFTPATLPDPNVGVPYTQTLTASGGTGPYTFALKAGSLLPSGLVMDGAGNISGTPDTVGPVTFTVQATDNQGYLGEQVYSLFVSTPCVTTPTGLIGWWKGDGNALDQLGKNNVTPGTITYSQRSGTQAFNLNGTTSYLEKTSPTGDLNLGNQSWSVSSWVKTSSQSASAMMVVSRYEFGWANSSNPGALYELILWSGGPSFRVRESLAGSQIKTVSDTTNVRDGKWHLITGILDRTDDTLKLYVDGQLKATQPVTGLGAINDAGSPLEIGRQFIQGWGSPTYYFDGQIDEVQIYNRALDSTEIQNINNAGTNSLCAAPNIAVTPASPFDFGSKAAGSTTPQTVTITNNGSADLSISAISLSADPNFTYTAGSCGSSFPKVLTPGQNCTATVNYAPTQLGSKTATLTVTSNDPDTSGWPVTFNGTATARQCTWTNTSGGNWSVPGNWSNCGGGTPGATDDAVITLAGNYTVTVDIHATVNSLNFGAGSGAQQLYLSDRTLTIMNASTINAGALFTHANGGTLGGPGDLTVNGTMNWVSGIMSGSGSTNIATGATLIINSGGITTLDGRTINNAGTVTYQGATSFYHNGKNGAVFNNLAGGVFDFQNNASILDGGGADPVFNNYGTFKKSAGTGESSFRYALNNIAPGSVDVQTGKVSLDNDGAATNSTGSFSAAPGATLNFYRGGYNLNAGSSLSGAGTIENSTFAVVYVNGTYNIPGTVRITGSTGQMIFNTNGTIGTLYQNGGFLGGTGTVTLTGAGSYWAGGTMNGSGSTDIAADATLQINATTSYLDGRTINNAGTVTYQGGPSGYYHTVKNGAVFNNLAGGVFDLQNNEPIVDGGGADAVFNNYGTLKKSAGAGESSFRYALNNIAPGVVDVQTGKVSLDNDGAATNSTGSFSAASGATLNFYRGVYNLNAGSSLSGAGTIENSTFAVVYVNGTYNIPGTVRITGGTGQMNFNTNGSIGTLYQSNGYLGGTGTVTLTGTGSYWSGGTMNGSGSTDIAALATLQINASTSYLDGRTINNAGTVTYQGGPSGYYHTVKNGAVFNNLAGGVFDLQNNEPIVDGGGADAIFNNYGTFKKSAGTGESTLYFGLNNIAPGVVDVQIGKVTLDYNSAAPTTSTGSFTAASGATLSFLRGIYNLNAGSSLSGAGTIENSNFAVVTVNGSYNIPGTLRITAPSGQMKFNTNGSIGNLYQTNGILGGTGTITLTGTGSYWSGGTMNGSGSTDIASGATLQINASGNSYLDGRTINNAGTVTYVAAGSYSHSGQNGAVFNNLAGGVFDLQGDRTFGAGGGTAPVFNNYGLFKKSSGAGASFSDLYYNFDLKAGSAIDPIAGTIRFSRTVTNSANAIFGSPAAASYGRIEKTSTLVLNAANTLNVNIGSADAYNTLYAFTTATLAGTLKVSLIGGFDPAIGNSFTIMTFASKSGAFGTLNLPLLGSGKKWNLAYNATNVVLSVVAGVAVSPATLPEGTTGIAYSQTVTASGGTAPYTFALKSGSSLPSGITLDGTGTISGTPDTVGLVTFTLQATDSLNNIGEQTYSVLINTPCVSSSVLPGLVGWWKGDGNTNDQLGLSNGTLMNGATFAPGRVGQAFSLNTANGYVNIQDSNAFAFVNKPFTIETWIKRTGNFTGTAGFGVIFDRIESGTGNGYRLDYSTSENNLRLLGSTTLQLPYTLDQDKWYHVAAVSNGEGTATIYVDGVVAGTGAYYSSLPYNVAPRIGIAQNGDAVFKGLIDEVQLFNRALTPVEILAQYNAGSNGVCTAPAATLSPSTHNLGNVPVGGSASWLYSITNSGTAPLNVSGVTVSGPEFSVNTTGGSCVSLTPTLAAGASCTVNVTLAPTSGGAKSGTVTVKSDVEDVTATLSGNGTTTGVCNWNTDVNGDWSDITKWSCGHAPEVNDDVNITVAGSYTVTVGSGSQFAKTLTANSSGFLNVSGGSLLVSGATNASGSVSVSGGTLTLNGTSSIATLNLTSGTMNGAGNLAVTGVFTQSGGTWNQVSATLPSFSANDFRIAGGTFIRVLGGDGSSGAPHQLTDVYGLQGMGSAGMLGKSYTLANNIDATGTVNWNGGAGFVPVGYTPTAYDGFNPTLNIPSTPFTGSFDGGFHTVSNLVINKPTGNFLGLFSAVSSSSSVRNIGLVGARVNGNAVVGSLVGYNAGTVSSSYADAGLVSGGSYANNIFGGLVGYNGGTVSSSYATASVTVGSGAVAGAGLVGLNRGGTVSNSYAAGVVNNGSGLTYEGTVVNSYWDMTKTPQAVSGTGLTTIQMKQTGSFTGWNISRTGGSGTTWRIYEGHTYPLLSGFLTPLTLADAPDLSVAYNGAAQSGAATSNGTVLGAPATGTNAGFYNGYYSTQQGYDLAGGNLTINPDIAGPVDGATLTATAVDSSQIDLAWAAAVDSGSGLAAANTYKLVRAVGTTAPSDCTGATVYQGTALAFSDTGRTIGTQYSYRVCAYDTLGNVSAGLTATATTDTACVTAPSGLVAWLPGNGNTNDLISGNNAMLVGGATATATGRVGQAFGLNGTGIVDMTVAAIDTTPGNNVTAQFWMFWNGQDNVIPFGFDQYALYLWGGTFGYTAASTGGNIYGISSAGLANRWVHVAAIFNNGDVTKSRLFIDGVEQSMSKLVTLGVPSSRSVTPRMVIGSWLVNDVYSSGYYYSFPGAIDEVQIYNRALDASEILAQYNAGSNGVCTAPTAALTPATYDLGNVAVGGSASWLYTIANSGTAPLNVTGVTVSGSEFRVSATGGTCASLNPVLAAGASCTVNVTLAPTSGGAKSGTVTVKSDAADVIAVLSANATLTITATADAGGSITPSEAITVNSGGSQSYNITPNSGYHIVDVLVDGVSQGAITSYSFTNVTAGHAINASFAANSYTITPGVTSGGSISPNTPQAVSYNGSVGFIITPNSGFSIIDVLVDGSSVGAVNSYNFTNVAASHTISVTFADITPPDVSITATPAGLTNQTGARYGFTSTDLAAGFECSLDGGLYVSCSSPADYFALTAGNHTFSVRAKDPAGNITPTPASFSWTIDTAAPGLSIDSKPGPVTTATTATFSFSSPDGSAAFQCKLDGGTSSICTSPLTYNSLAEGSHTFSLQAVDTVGNPSAPLSFSWIIDTTSPLNDGVVTATPGNGQATLSWTPFTDTVSSVASYLLVSTPTGSLPTDCTGGITASSPYTVTGLTNGGSYDFRICAVDAANNKSSGVSTSANPQATFVTISPTSNNFGNLAIGGTSAPVTFTITNSGPVGLNLTSLGIGGAQPGDFTRTGGSCGTPPVFLASSAICTVDIVFAPQSAVLADRSVVLSAITDEANTPTLSATLSGNATVSIIATAGANGSVTPAGTTTLAAGSAQNYSITPNIGYHIADVLVDGSSVGTVATYNFAGLSTSRAISASFAINSYTVSFNSTGGSSVSSQSVNYSNTATAPANPTKAGYTFAGWHSDAGLTSAFAFSTAITADTTLYAKWTINSYTVSFNSNGGSTVSSQSVNYGSTATAPANPSKSGHTFSGWYSDAGLTNAFVFSTAITSDTTLYAKWNINSYTVSFNSNGGNAVTSQSVAYSGTATAPANPTKAGNTFAGWFSDAGLSTPFVFSTPITADTTLYAKWTVNSYTVTFNSNGGNLVNSQSVAYNGTATAPANPAKAGNTFSGWYADAGLTNAFAFNTAITADTTLYAKWVINIYSVSFDSNGGSAVTSQSVAYSGTATAPANPTKAGNTFAGWYSDAGLSTPFVFSTPITADTTLYAKWTVNSYTVTFNSNGGNLVNSQSVAYNGTATAPAVPTKAGNTFVGWYLDAGFATPFIFSTPITADTTLYAKWSINSYTVSFNSNGGSEVTSQSVAYNGTATAPANPTKTGNAFAGWFSDAGLTTAFAFTTAITADTTLYAKWTINSYTVSFNSNGGSEVASQSVAYSGTATAPPAPTRPGYTFADWYSDVALNTPFVFTTAIIADKTLYARWTDTGSPVITSFSLSSNSPTLSASVTTLIVSDNVAVTHYLLSESATVPLASDERWHVYSAEPVPALSYTFDTWGYRKLYAFVKDTAGNVSLPFLATTIIGPTKGVIVPGGDNNEPTIADALKSLRIVMGLDKPPLTGTAEWSNLDVAPLSHGVPKPDNELNLGDTIVTLRRAVGLPSYLPPEQ